MPSKKPAAKSKPTRKTGAKSAPSKLRKAAAPKRPAKRAAPAKRAKSVKSARTSKPARKAAAVMRPARETATAARSLAPAKAAEQPSSRTASNASTLSPPTPETPATAARPANRATPVVATAVSRGTLRQATVEPQADGEETDDSAGLLAGPRNVKPYIAKRGEQYMNREQLEHFRQILLNWKRDLMEEVDRTVTHMKDEAANFPDPNDRATQEEEFSLELRTRDRERKLIRKIDEALKRIEDGTYGYCLETGEEIGIKRLEARPVATLSIEAQERRERRERQYGDRDDRYR